MRVLVTGAAGFVGIRLVEVLLENGFYVFGLDRMADDEKTRLRYERLSTCKQHSRFEFVRHNVTGRANLSKIFDQIQPQAVIALASVTSLTEFERDPITCWRINTEGTLQTMHACLQANVAHLVLGSSFHVYGASRKQPLGEDDLAHTPISQLGASFRAMELSAHAFSQNSRVCVGIARIFSVYGPRQSPDRFVPRIIASAQRRQEVPIIGDPTFSCDMIYVDDAVAGLLRMLERPRPYSILNLGTQNSTTLGQVAELICSEFGVFLKMSIQPARQGEMAQAWADISVARAQVGFEPAFDLARGIGQTVEWYKSNISG